MINFEHLTKMYGHARVVNDLSFAVRPGVVTGFLGPNGAGKTTTLRMATNLVVPDTGSITFDGRAFTELDKPLRHVGVALEPVCFHPGRTAINHLMMLAPYAGVGKDRCHEMLKFVGLEEAAHKTVGHFSLGMRGRLNLACALLGDPQTLLLDEPINGLDPEGIRWIRELLKSLAAQGRTVLISSHVLSEIQQTVNDVVVIAHGSLIFAGALSELESQHNVARTLVVTSQRDALLALAAARGWAITDEQNSAYGPNAVLIEGPSSAEISQQSLAAGILLEQLASQNSGLEDLFLSLTEGQAGMR